MGVIFRRRRFLRFVRRLFRRFEPRLLPVGEIIRTVFPVLIVSSAAPFVTFVSLTTEIFDVVADY